MRNQFRERTGNHTISRRQWLAYATPLATSALLVTRGSAQQKLLPLHSSGLDHLSIAVPDPLRAATFYGRIFDPQVFHERTGVQRYYVRLGAAYIAFGPQANVTPYIDHIAAGVIVLSRPISAKPRSKRITTAGLAAPPGVLPMLSDPDQLRLQLVNATHGLFDTLMPGGRVVTEPSGDDPYRARSHHAIGDRCREVRGALSQAVRSRGVARAQSGAGVVQARGYEDWLGGRARGRSRAFRIFASRSQGLTAPRPRIAFKSSASKWNRVAEKHTSVSRPLQPSGRSSRGLRPGEFRRHSDSPAAAGRCCRPSSRWGCRRRSAW